MTRGKPEATVGAVMAGLAVLRVTGALNIYDEEESVRWGDSPGEATRRRRALRRYLASHWSAPTVLVGEAPGKNGARRTGLPFTSMRQMTGEGPAEPTATTVQRVLGDLGQEKQVLLWNVSMLFAADNRDPRRCEIDACSPMLDLVCRGRKVLAVGRHAALATGAPYIRHPSHGGGSLFAAGLQAALAPAGCGDVPSRQPVGTLDLTMHPSPEPRRRGTSPPEGRRLPGRGRSKPARG